MRWSPILWLVRTNLVKFTKGEFPSGKEGNILLKNGDTAKGKQAKTTSRPQKSKLKAVYKVKSVDQALNVLRHQFNNHIFDTNKSPIDFFQWHSKDLKRDTYGQNMLIFDQLLTFKKKYKKPVAKSIFYVLLRQNMKKINSNMSLTTAIQSCVEQDGNNQRANRLLKLSEWKNTVAANKLIEYNLSQFRLDDALKMYNNCKKWQIKPNVQTGVILFDGISRQLKYEKFEERKEALLSKLIDIYEEIPADVRQISVFNALLSCLVKNFANDQEMAWIFFDKLNGLEPDATTFSIFLKGLNEFKDYRRDQINQDPNKSQGVKFSEYHELEKEFIINVELITAKLNNIDGYFAKDYMKCFKTYPYVSQGFRQLYNWCQEFKILSDDLKLDFSYNRDVVYSKQKELTKVSNELHRQLEYAEPKVQQADYSKNDIDMNKFLMQQIIENLFILDRPVQFINTIWYILKMYGGIDFAEFPKISEDKPVQVNYESPNSAVIDRQLIEYMMFFINKQFYKKMKASTISIQLLNYVQDSRIEINNSTYRCVLNIINDELKYFTRLNYNQAMTHAKYNTNDRPRSNTLTGTEVRYLVQNLNSILATSSKELNEEIGHIMNKIINCEWEVKTFKEFKDLNKFVIETIKTDDVQMNSILDKCRAVAYSETNK